MLLGQYSLWKILLDILRHMERAESLPEDIKYIVSLLEIRKGSSWRNMCFYKNIISKELLMNLKVGFFF